MTSRNLILAIIAILGIVSLWAQEAMVRQSGESLRDFCKRNLPENTEFAHPPLQLGFSPSARNIVVLFRPADGVNTNYTGWVLVPEHEGGEAYYKYDLPPMAEIPGRFDISVEAVFAAGGQSIVSRELVVLYRYHRNGSRNDDGYVSYVYRWTNNSFEVVSDVSRELAGLRTADVRRKLQAIERKHSTGNR